MKIRKIVNLLSLITTCFVFPTLIYFSVNDVKRIDYSGNIEKPELGNKVAVESVMEITANARLDELYLKISELPPHQVEEGIDVFLYAAQAKRQAEKYTLGTDGLTDTFPVFGVQDIRSTLDDSEDFIYFTTVEKNNFGSLYIVHITGTFAQLWKSESDLKKIENAVSSLRCGLDLREWYVNSEYCRTQFPAVPEQVSMEQLPFDTGASNKLFNDIFAKVTHVSNADTFRMVVSGPLASLPMNVLVTKIGTNYADTEWFIDTYTHTIHPTVQAYFQKRSKRGKSQAERKTLAFLGIGNPTLVGDTSSVFYDSQFKKASRMSRAFTSCTTGKLFGFGKVGRFVPRFNRNSKLEVSSNGLALQESIIAMTPLPESAYEICSVSENFKTIKKRMLLSKYAREKTIKTLSDDGKLEDYNVIHIASHAIVDEAGNNNATGIVLTPHSNASERDDGFLNIDEISKLRLNADWVILSACNTGSIGKENGRILGGLSEAFSKANARSLLVANWSVSSRAAMDITTRTVTKYVEDMQTKYDALRDAILEVRQQDGIAQHPAYWGPFTLIES